MSIVIGGIYRTESGAFLRLDSRGDLLYNFTLVDQNKQVIPEVKNKRGMVVVRSNVSYSEEVVLSFKKV